MATTTTTTTTTATATTVGTAPERTPRRSARPSRPRLPPLEGGVTASKSKPAGASRRLVRVQTYGTRSHLQLPEISRLGCRLR